ncbi:MAG: type II secretion system protein [Kiritimatiellae bacterium]|nr:type II secretion system protein [Kiritimatiellia bacterium]
MRRGFTLAETMVAMLVSGIVIAAVMFSFLSTQRMMATAMAESELALAVRGIREKLLFRAAPEVNGVHYAGLLSGTNPGQVVETGSGYILMQMRAFGNSLSDVRDQSVRLVMDGAPGSRHLVNERIPNKDRYARWLWPGRFPLVDEQMTEVVSTEGIGNQPSGVYRVLVDVNLAAQTARDRVVRRERVSIPLLGRLQPMKNAAGEY